MTNRYILVPPVSTPEGDPFWRVGDTQFVTGDGEPIPNFAVVEIHVSVPNAEQEARMFCDRLNGSPALHAGLDQKLDLVLEKLGRLLEPIIPFDLHEYRKRNGIRDLPGGG